MNHLMEYAKNSELGKKTKYDQTYNPKRLHAISRAEKRKEMGVHLTQLPFVGFDYWNHYEVSWLNTKGKPMVAIAEIVYDCSSPAIVESKALKLYFNSLNYTVFSSMDEVERIVKCDLEAVVHASVEVHIQLLDKTSNISLCNSFSGTCLDNLDIECHTYTIDSSFLATENEMVSETLYSDLLKSNCLVTQQPDWGSVQIIYRGKKINHAGLLRYIVSYRNHNEFHEQCIERIFVDIMKYCQPEELTVYGRYTRRGGLDINPYRSTQKTKLAGKNIRLLRQ